MRTVIHNVSKYRFLVLLSGDNNGVATKFFNDDDRRHISTVTHKASRDQLYQFGVVVLVIPSGIENIYIETTIKNGATSLKYLLL